jgi:hypothetical protein
MPAQNGVRRHKGRDLREQPPAKSMAQNRQAPTVTVVEAQALPGEPRLQNAILLPQERDDIGLLTIEPAAQRCEQQPERKHARSLRDGRRSIYGTVRRLPDRVERGRVCLRSLLAPPFVGLGDERGLGADRLKQRVRHPPIAETNDVWPPPGFP